MADHTTYAVAPLLSRENLGRQVLVSWNSNKPNLAPITKIGRTNIHVGTIRTYSLKVHPSGDRASNLVNGYMVSAITVAAAEEEKRRANIINRLREILRFPRQTLPTEALEKALAALTKGGE